MELTCASETNLHGPANKKGQFLSTANETDSSGAAILHAGSSNQPKCRSVICPNAELELWSVPGRRQCCTLSLRQNRLGLNYWRESFLFAHGCLPARGTCHQICVCVCVSVYSGCVSISLDWIRATTVFRVFMCCKTRLLLAGSLGD